VHNAQWATESGDDGSNDLLVSQLIRKDELQAWFLAQHLVNVPVVRADQPNAAASGSLQRRKSWAIGTNEAEKKRSLRRKKLNRRSGR
jgi:hypothetical protein